MTEKRQLWIQFSIISGIIIFLNLLSDQFFFRIDLTEEKRYSLSPVSHRTVDSLQRIITVKIYLDGKLPAPIKRYADAVRTTLLELKASANDQIQFRFEDPTENPSLQKLFQDKGIMPIPVNVKTANETSKTYIFPVASLTCNGKEEFIDLFKGCSYPNGQIDLLKAEQSIEYKFITAIQRIITQNPRVVGILRGQKQYSADKTAELVTEIKQFYTVLDITLKDSVEIPASKKFLPKEIQETLRGEGIDVLLVTQPDTAFTEREKYELDQYIMRGGRILWILDVQKVDLKNGPTLSMFRNLNLDDFFPNYGLKINYDLVQDISCGMLDVVQGFNNGPVWSAEKWLYYPMIYEQTDHPVCKNVDALLFRYANSIDTLPRANVKHEVLVRSSEFSRTVQGQVYVDINELLNNPPPISTFKNNGRRILASAVSGNFKSLFTGRSAPTDAQYPRAPMATFLEMNRFPTKMVLIADGQMALGNDYRGRIEFMPFDNKTFLMNCIDYLMENEALTEVRAKDLKIRTLDKEKVKENVLLIQILNVVMPVVLVILYGILRFYLRRKQNESYQQK